MFEKIVIGIVLTVIVYCLHEIDRLGHGGFWL